MDIRPHTALARFGLGRRGVEPLPADPAAWLAAQLGPAPAPEVPPGGADAAAAFAALAEARRNPPSPGQPGPPRMISEAEIAALADQALATDQPFRERLVRFWSNHFAVSTRSGAAWEETPRDYHVLHANAHRRGAGFACHDWHTRP